MLKVAKPARTIEQRLDEEQRPAIANPIEGLAEGRRVGPVRGLVHIASVTAFAAVYSDLQFDSDYRSWRLEW